MDQPTIEPLLSVPPPKGLAFSYPCELLRNEEDLEAFKRHYERSLHRRGGNRFPVTVGLDYLASSETYAFFNANRTMVAGFVLRTEAPFRCVHAIPAERRPEIPLLVGADGDLSELTCVWRNRGFPNAMFGALGWSVIVSTCVRVGRKRILGVGFDNKANDLYKVAAPTLLYEGPSSNPDMPLGVHVYAFTKTRLVMNFALNFATKMPRRVMAPRSRVG